MKLYNTLTKQKENFIPLEENKVKMYVCGPTVYDFIHIGNARPYVVFDTIRRYFEYKGYDVTYVQNFTDVDDKIINKANSEGVDTIVIANRYIEEALKDAKALNVKAPTYAPRVTEEIKEIKEMIQTLIEQKNAYEVNGTVFFDTKSFKEYGKLSGKKLDELEIGSRIKLDEAKKNDTDFVLWKPKKEGEIAWESPWGEGRPGWHIECSVMAKKYLGEEIDIHAGGEDLIFPHHENEIAQSECCNHRPFAKYWLHNGFINIDNEKMSKSKGNFFTVRDIANEIPYDVIRFFILCGHYRAPINFSREAMEASKKGLDRIKNCVNNLNHLINSSTTENLTDEENTLDIFKNISGYKNTFEEEMDNDFNTSNAITCIFEIVRLINSVANDKSSKEFLQKLLDEILSLCNVLGILYETEKEDNIDENEIERLIEKRQEAKKNKDYKLADEIRDSLKEKGIILRDTSAGVIWSKE
ncbi:cysteine--tRNA ligase [uncultured Tyzzerella sp.]|uniref:cysteine--tRNA ligase n=1 Tax=uncultured Tyzzerella sp. TaxID=2321398 RepID=UPI002941EEDF|nr:cysteine--tRNA ligase [uncultured Tyzzerella sp.]